MVTTMASLNFSLPAIGMIFLVAAAPCGSARAEKQSDLSLQPQTHAARQYAVGDQVPSSIKVDDDGFPNRPYAILIVDGAVVVVIDRTTRRVVEVIR
jgi:hypothetical protein